MKGDCGSFGVLRCCRVFWGCWEFRVLGALQAEPVRVLQTPLDPSEP